MEQEKIDYLREYFKLTNDISDADIIKHCCDTMESARYDIRIKMDNLKAELHKVFPSFLLRLFRIDAE